MTNAARQFIVISEVMNMGMEQKIKTAIAYMNTTQANLAEAVGMTPQNFNQKMKRATFTEEELQQIAEALGASFVPFSFQFPDGMKI